MSQYVPMGRAKNMPPFDRHITEDEYAAVCSYLELCDIENGYTQDFSSAIQDYIPNLICPVYETGRKFPQLDKTNV